MFVKFNLVVLLWFILGFILPLDSNDLFKEGQEWIQLVIQQESVVTFWGMGKTSWCCRLDNRTDVH